MTPEESGDVSLETTAQDLGFDTVDAMVAAAKKSKAHDAYDGRQSKRMRELEAQVAELQERKHEADLGIGDDADEVSRRLAREIRELQSTVTTLTRKLAASPEDEELEPFYQNVLTEYPEVKQVKDPIRRMEMARRLARQLKTESEKPDTPKGGRDVSGAHLTGGDSPVSRRSSLSEEQELARYERERAEAGNEAAKQKVDAKYRAKFPNWGI